MYAFFKAIYRFFVSIQRRILTWYWTWRVRMACGSYKPPVKANFRTMLSKNTHLEKNTNFNGLIVAGEGKVTIGQNFHSGRNCKVITAFHNYDSGETIPYDKSYITKDVVIEDNVWFGDDIIVLGGVSIGEGAVIQAGSVVVKNIPKLAIAGGHPAVPFKYRNEEHYYKLKSEGKFL